MKNLGVPIFKYLKQPHPVVLFYSNIGFYMGEIYIFQKIYVTTSYTPVGPIRKNLTQTSSAIRKYGQKAFLYRAHGG